MLVSYPSYFWIILIYPEGFCVIIYILQRWISLQKPIRIRVRNSFGVAVMTTLVLIYFSVAMSAAIVLPFDMLAFLPYPFVIAIMIIDALRIKVAPNQDKISET